MHILHSIWNKNLRLFYLPWFTQTRLFSAFFRASSIILATLASPAQTASANPSVIHSFSGSDGEYAFGALVLASNGIAYGTTQQGGLFGDGTIFSVDSYGQFKLLHSFSDDIGQEGRVPRGRLVEGADGALCGTTTDGGGSNPNGGIGTIFCIKPDGSFRVLYSFNSSGNTAQGSWPQGGMALGTDGSLYGTTSYGGAHGVGAVFKITPSGSLSVIYSFSNTTDSGAVPCGDAVIGPDGRIYGTTQIGGKNGDGTIFAVSYSGIFSTLHSFTGNVDGYTPIAGLLLGSDGYLYGSTLYGGPRRGQGTLFRISPSGSEFSLLYTFKKNSGEVLTPLIEMNGLLYGTDVYGTLFDFNVSDKALRTLYTFRTSSNAGYRPVTGVLNIGGGKLLGATEDGASNGRGALYEYSVSN